LLLWLKTAAGISKVEQQQQQQEDVGYINLQQIME